MVTSLQQCEQDSPCNENSTHGKRKRAPPGREHLGSTGGHSTRFLDRAITRQTFRGKVEMSLALSMTEYLHKAISGANPWAIRCHAEPLRIRRSITSKQSSSWSRTPTLAGLPPSAPVT